MSQRYQVAKERYAEFGIDTEKAIAACAAIPLSIHCWQGDDLQGFEKHDASANGGLQATGNYPGRARTMDELFADLDLALSFIPGVKKVGVHACYTQPDAPAADRDAITPAHFTAWADWACSKGIGLDFNGTFFAHPKADSGYTLSHADDAIRSFWVEHGLRCREIAAYLAQRTGKTCVHNIWIPDGEKEVPVDTHGPRARLTDSLDKILAKPAEHVVDAVESKLFGLGSEAYVVGSMEYYLGYTLSRKHAISTFDMGHYHPTETVSSKISALMQFCPNILLHVSRPVRWDSDHVVAYDDELRQLMREIFRAGVQDRIYFSTDYFDASINRIFAWVIGARNTRKAMLEALLEPSAMLREVELKGDTSSRLALLEEMRTMPFAAVFDELCRREGCTEGVEWMQPVKDYEKNVLIHRR